MILTLKLKYTPGLAKALAQVEDKGGNATHTHVCYGKSNFHNELFLKP
jgi:hypothetical protein